LNTEYKYVIHAHPLNLVALSFNIDKIIPNTYDTKLILGGQLAVINPKSHYDLIDYIDQESLTRGIIIERGHGVYVARNDPYEAVNMIETLEHLSSILLK
jgi:ribulose-5-phosphate 4-epimerase/fuculose-1-phosphate aldolase